MKFFGMKDEVLFEKYLHLWTSGIAVHASHKEIDSEVSYQYTEK